MNRTGRPRGSGYDDLLRIVRIRRHMADTGSSRRAAILAHFGPDQLRRLEKKLAAITSDQILSDLTHRLRTSRDWRERKAARWALLDEGYLVLSLDLEAATEGGTIGSHLMSNTLNPFADDPAPRAWP